MSLAWDVQEELEAGPEVTAKLGKRAIGCPGVIDILCYSYCYLGLLTGGWGLLGSYGVGGSYGVLWGGGVLWGAVGP